MTDTARLYLVSPVVSDAAAFAPVLEAACGAGETAALLLRLAPADDRTQINRIKQLAPVAQQHGAAVLVDASPQAAVRGGADGVHLTAPDPETLEQALETLQPDRVVGVSIAGAELRHDAMLAGEANVDYLMFGGSGQDDNATLEQAEWWAGVFATPCVACAGSLDQVGPLAATGAEFVALGPWAFDGDVADTVRQALQILASTEVATA